MIRQIRESIVRPALLELGLWSPAAEALVIGTGAHESAGYRYLRQVGGPALSWWQIEPATYEDLIERTLPRVAGPIASAYLAMIPRRFASLPPADFLVQAPYFAAATCRLLYYRVPAALPDAGDIAGLAGYWKQYYNTAAGKGQPSQWMAAYHRYCA